VIRLLFLAVQVADGTTFDWIKNLSTLGGGTVMAVALYYFLTDRVRTTKAVHERIDEWKQLYAEAKAENQRNLQRLDETISRLHDLVEASERQKREITQLKDAVKSEKAP
jgi:L-lactate utilization protein LutB